MTTKAKEKKTSRILEAVHETARDLQAAGFVSKRRMKDYDALKGTDEHGQARTITDG
jgi:DNA-binding transcriptional regulator YiaG